MNCVLCGGSSFSVVSPRLRHGIRRPVVRCDGCALVSLDEPDTDVMDYDTEYGEKHGPVIGRGSTPSELFQLYRAYMPERVERLSHLLRPEAAVLEIGCSTGFFLDAIAPRVARAVGVELNLDRGEFARGRGLEVHVGRVEKTGFPDHSFDVIFLFQVFEHVTDPLTFLETCRRLLAPDGTIYLEVPNVDDALLTCFGVDGYRDFYWRAPHAYYYSQQTLPKILAKAGFGGSVRFSQEYSLFNHVNWLFHDAPQPSVTVARGAPWWDPPPGSEGRSSEVRAWLERADADYRAMLERLGIAQNLCYEGRPVP